MSTRLMGAFMVGSLGATMLTGVGTALADVSRERSGSAVTTSDIEATVTDVISRLASAATARAESVGGYTLTTESTWDDGGINEETWHFHVDNSVRFSGTYRASNGKSWTEDYILDGKAGTFSQPPGGSDETRRAWRLIKAHPDAWIVRNLTGPDAIGWEPDVPTMKWDGQAGGLLTNILLPEVPGGFSRFDYRVISGDFSSPRLISMRLLHISGEEATFSITVDEQGLPTKITMTGDDATKDVAASYVAHWQYEEPLIQQPTGRLAVPYALFARAVQSFKLPAIVKNLATRIAFWSKLKTPAGLREQAPQSLIVMRVAGLRIPIKLIEIRYGVRLQARNPFTRQVVQWDVEVRPNSWPTIYDSSPRR